MATASSIATLVADMPVTSVGLYDLARQRERLGTRIEDRIDQVLMHGQFILGPEVEELERNLAAFCGARHAIAVSSGRDALTMALMAIGVGPGDAVFVPGFTFSASAAAIAPLGATPFFVDVDERSFNLDAAAFEAAVDAVLREGRLVPRVVMPVDLYGLRGHFGDCGEAWHDGAGGRRAELRRRARQPPGGDAGPDHRDQLLPDQAAGRLW